MLTADEIIDILKEREAFDGFCKHCEYAEHLKADDYGPAETTCERCGGETMDTACCYYDDIKERCQDIANWIEIFEGEDDDV